MSFLHALVKAMFPSRDVRVDVLPDRDAYRVSVLFTAKDLARYSHDPEGGARHLGKLRPVKRQRRRLHWGRCRPSSGVLRLEHRGRFGTAPTEALCRRFGWVMNKLGAP